MSVRNDTLRFPFGNESSTNHYYQAAIAGSGVNASANGFVVIRIGQSTDSNNPSGADQNLRVIVQDTNGSSAAFTASALSRLLYPDTWNVKMVMQTLRVPLSLLRLHGLNAAAISTVKLAFDQVGAGTVYFDELQVSN